MATIVRLLIAIFCAVCGSAAALAQQTAPFSVAVGQVSGQVVDSLSGEPLSYVNIYAGGTDGGCLTDEGGKFRYRSGKPVKYLRITSMGYAPKVVSGDSLALSPLTIRLAPASYTLQEVVVNPGKRKYSRKNNPAVDLMERIRQQAKRSNPKDSDFYSYDKYEKMVISLSNFRMPDSASRTAKRMPFLRDYIDTIPFSKDPVLKVSLKEKSSTMLFSGNRDGGKEIIYGLKSAGIDKSFNQENIQAALEDNLREIDIFADDINILQNRFVSPLSLIGPYYYKYFMDTVSRGGRKVIELSFAPHNPQSMGFNGRLWVDPSDSTCFVEGIEMRVPNDINLNFVKSLHLSQQFHKDERGKRHVDTDDIAIEFQLMPGTPGVYAHRLTDYRNHTYGRRADLEEFYSRPGSRFMASDAEEKDEIFWHDARTRPLPKSERDIGSLLQKLRKSPLFYWGEKILTVLVQGYIHTGKKSKFDIGPVNTFISTNKAEGVRFRLGGMTTAYLFPHVFARGYVAYGLKDKKWKYRGELEYSFNAKKYHSREFPMHLIRAEYQYDTDRIGEHYLFTNPDNIFLSIKRKGSFLITYRRLIQASYIQEFPFNLTLTAGLRSERQEATPWVSFIRADGSAAHHFNQAAFFVSLRYAPGEKFVQSASSRRSLNMDAPVFQLTHEYGPRKLFGADFTLNKTEFSFQKRFWFSAFGYLNVVAKLGKIWSSVYYPALLWQNANLSYTIQPESYALLNPMEFAMDQYASVDMEYFGNGILFNRVPLIKKLKIREVVTFKGFFGHLSKRNNPQYNSSLFRFPVDANVGLLNSTPYMEAGIGIDNILSILRVDYMWRLTYRHRPYIDKSGVRISLHFSF